MNEQIETRVEVKAFRVNLVCEECGEGNMICQSGMVLLGYPSRHPHKCNNCGHSKYVFEKMYPYTSYEEVSK